MKTLPTLPLTKSAQSLRPLNVPVPSYVLAIEKLAISASLTVRRMGSRPKSWKQAHLFFSGSREQIMKLELLTDPDSIHWPNGTRVPSKLQLKAVFPERSSYGHEGLLHLIGGGMYVLKVRVDLPDSSSVLDGGVERFDFNIGKEDERAVFVGHREQLIKAGIAPADLFPNDSDQSSNGLHKGDDHRFRCTEHTQRLHGGQWAYTTFPRRTENHSTRQAVTRADYQKPEEWLDKILSDVRTAVRWIQEITDVSVIAQSGVRYAVDPAKLSEIFNEIEAAAQQIRDLPVRIEILANSPQRKEARDKAALASSDGDFQRFMQAAIVRPQDPGYKLPRQ